MRTTKKKLMGGRLNKRANVSNIEALGIEMENAYLDDNFIKPIKTTTTAPIFHQPSVGTGSKTKVKKFFLKL